MAEHDHARLHPEPCGQGLGDRDNASSARTLRDHHDSGSFAAALAVLDAIANVVEAEWNFGDHDGLGAAPERNRDCDKARVAAHHLDAENAFVGERSVADAVDRLE